MLADPRSHFIVGRAGRDERLKDTVVNFSKLRPPLIERAVGVVFPLPAEEDGPAFVHRPGSQYVARQGFAR